MYKNHAKHTMFLTNHNKNQVILVDEKDQEIGQIDKLEAHQKGLLHRAFSIFIQNHKGELLLQKRAFSKYHSAGLWSNTCCSHPMPGESLEQATSRRLLEEMGFSCPVQPVFSFIYQCELEHGLQEHEFDHVYKGMYNQDPKINTNEVSNYQWISIQNLSNDLQKQPEKYTYWLKFCWPMYLKSIS